MITGAVTIGVVIIADMGRDVNIPHLPSTLDLCTESEVAAHRKLLSVFFVPKTAPHDALFSVSFGEIACSLWKKLSKFGFSSIHQQ
jgi:hypothetical protein